MRSRGTRSTTSISWPPRRPRRGARCATTARTSSAGGFVAEELRLPVRRVQGHCQVDRPGVRLRLRPRGVRPAQHHLDDRHPPARGEDSAAGPLRDPDAVLHPLRCDARAAAELHRQGRVKPAREAFAGCSGVVSGPVINEHDLPFALEALPGERFQLIGEARGRVLEGNHDAQLDFLRRRAINRAPHGAAGREGAGAVRACAPWHRVRE
jgi:hypothetical protein